MKITHYAVRDLHADSPDDYALGEHDVLAKTADGRVYYSEEMFDSVAEARAFMCAEIAKPSGFDYWEDMPLDLASNTTDLTKLDWVAV